VGYQNFAHILLDNSDAMPKQTEKDQKRKLTHSQIEKKRREKIQECLTQLHRLVPKNASQSNLQKLQILENTVEVDPINSVHKGIAAQGIGAYSSGNGHFGGTHYFHFAYTSGKCRRLRI
jgi:hypothetical protein